MNNGLFAPVGQQQMTPQSQIDAMNAMAQQQRPQMAPPVPAPTIAPEQAQADAMDALAAQQQMPKYTGDPIVDKYIHAL